MKNKNTITVIFTSLLIVFFYRALPGLSSQLRTPALLVYDAGGSRLVSLLESSQTIHLSTYPSEEKMRQVLADGDVPQLGLVIPAGFDGALQAGGTPVLQGYVLRWVDAKAAASLKSIAEAEISNLLGQAVGINLDGNRVDLRPESDGLNVQAGFGFAFVIIMIGVILIPHLMLEEKQHRTLDVLTVSPASAGQIVAGKALAGLFYCSLGGVVALAVNQVLVVHWWLALVTVVLGSLFTVSLGLWLGIKIESRAELSVWSWVILLPLIMPMVFVLLQGLVPDALVSIAKVIPSAAIFDLVRISFANPIPIGRTLLLLAWIAAAAGLVLAVVAWIISRRDRESEVFSSSWRQSLTHTVEGSQNLFTPLLERIARLRPPQDAAGRQPAVTGEGAFQESRPRRGLDMIRIIAAKDLVEALKNRLVLSILVGSILILASAALLPLLLSSSNLPRMVVFDQGRSTILHDLAAREGFRVSIVATRKDMEATLTSSPDLWLGLVLPADFDQRAVGGQSIELQGYYSHWTDTNKLSQQAAFFDEQFRSASRATVHLSLAGGAVYPPADLGGVPLMLQLNMVAVILVIGVALVPLLMIEEKEAQTLKVLLVSPASLKQVVAGKALVGLFFSLLPALVVMAFYHRQIVHWEVAILAILLTAVLAVLTGLLLGILSDSATTVSMWGSLVLVLLLGSAILKLFPGLNLPPAIQAALDWLPGSAMLQLFNISRAGEIPAGMLYLNVSALLAAIAVVYLLLSWRVRAMER